MMLKPKNRSNSLLLASAAVAVLMAVLLVFADLSAGMRSDIKIVGGIVGLSLWIAALRVRKQ